MRHLVCIYQSPSPNNYRVFFSQGGVAQARLKQEKAQGENHSTLACQSGLLHPRQSRFDEAPLHGRVSRSRTSWSNLASYMGPKGCDLWTVLRRKSGGNKNGAFFLLGSFKKWWKHGKNENLIYIYIIYIYMCQLLWSGWICRNMQNCCIST